MDGELKAILYTGGIVGVVILLIQCFYPGGLMALGGILSK